MHVSRGVNWFKRREISLSTIRLKVRSYLTESSFRFRKSDGENITIVQPTTADDNSR